MSTKEKTTKQEKQPRTVKVVTLVKVAVAIAALTAMYALGAWTTNEQNKAHDQEVQTKASQLVEELVTSKAKH